jgi:hypothetical protein
MTDYGAYVGAIVEAIEECRTFARKTRFNWASIARGDMEAAYAAPGTVAQESKQTNILNLIDKLPKLPQQHPTMRYHYELLCDFVHPNAGSRSLVINKVEELGPDQKRYTLSFPATSPELLAACLHFISAPVAKSLLLFGKQLASVSRSLGDIENRLSAAEAAGRDSMPG